MKIVLKAIGYVESPFKSRDDVPRQACYSDAFGTVVVYPEFEKGLQDLDMYDYIFIVYFFDKVKEFQLITKPYEADVLRGVFATRSPRRPNPIGISVVKLVKIQGNKILIKGIDVIDQTPVLDIKPFVPNIDCYPIKNQV